MTPGPIKWIKCPHCGGRARYATLNSGNTFGAQTWTDGKQIAPMLPLPPAIVKCAHCPDCYWLSDAKTIGEMDPWGDETTVPDPSWKDDEWIEEPNEEEYAKLLGGSLMNSPERERSLRILAWWRANDSGRVESASADDPPRPQPKWFQSNLEALVGLMDETEVNDLLMKAELLRELGRFNEAETVLKHVASPSYADVVRQFRSHCARKDTRVRELDLGS